MFKWTTLGILPQDAEIDATSEVENSLSVSWTWENVSAVWVGFSFLTEELPDGIGDAEEGGPGEDGVEGPVARLQVAAGSQVLLGHERQLVLGGVVHVGGAHDWK